MSQSDRMSPSDATFGDVGEGLDPVHRDPGLESVEAAHGFEEVDRGPGQVVADVRLRDELGVVDQRFESAESEHDSLGTDVPRHFEVVFD